MHALRETDLAFAAACDEAFADANDDIELTARRWACHGELPGESTGVNRPEVIRRYSEQLLILLLKTNLPHKYDPHRSGRVAAPSPLEIAQDPDPPRSRRGRVQSLEDDGLGPIDE